MKVNKLSLLFSVSIFFLIFFSSFIDASFTKGNASESIISSYNANDYLRGWINFSVNNEPYDSLISAFDSSITLKSLLDKNNLRAGVHYNCSSLSCNNTYGETDSASSTKSFTLNSDSSKLIGLKITDSSFSSITSLNLNFNSNALEDCNVPLKIDVGANNDYDWVANKQKLNTYCSAETYSSCYSSSSSGSFGMQQGVEYCQAITINSASALLVGAAVNGGSSDSGFVFSTNVSTDTCTSFASSGKASCLINKTITSPTAVKVCFFQRNGTAYNINFEQSSPVCGFKDSYQADFSIFIQSMKFDSVGNVITNSTSTGSSFASILNDYLISQYGSSSSKCSQGCYIPINFYSSQANQQININSIQLKYNNGGGDVEVTNIYSLNETPATISFPLSLIYLDNASLKVPNSSGNYNLSLKLAGNEILTKQISLLNVPTVLFLSPTELPAGVPVNLTLNVSGTNITGYYWDFGDNSTLTTNVSYVSHTYSMLGSYSLKVSVRNNNGETNKTYIMNVTSPKDYTAYSINDTKLRVAYLKSQLNSFPPTVKAAIDIKFNLTNIETQLGYLQSSYDSAGSNSVVYIDIINSLNNISLPDSFNRTQKYSGKFIFDKTKINLNDLKTLTGEEFSGSDQYAQDSIFGWFIDNIDASVDLSVYAYNIKNITYPLLTYGLVKFDPKSGSDIGTVYVIINKPANSINILGSSAKSIGNSVGLVLTSAKSFEFTSNEKYDLVNFPMYVSPSLTQIEDGIIVTASECNQNGVCDIGENSANCRVDCNPRGKIFLSLLAIFVIFFVLYICAQEWYKRKYESYLFKDKNDLFNLINFINNSEKQGMSREAIIVKLKEKGWHGEQIEYAYKKFKGERTGMWEIPVLKFLENKKVGQEIELRNGMPNLPPRPNIPFAPKGMIKMPPQQRPINQNVQGMKNSMPPQNKPFNSAVKSVNPNVKSNNAKPQSINSTQNNPNKDKK